MEGTQSSKVKNAVGATAGSGPQPGRATGGAILTALDGESSQGDDHPSTAGPPVSQTVPTAQLDAYYRMESRAATSSRSAAPFCTIESNALFSYSSLELTYDFDCCTAIESSLGFWFNTPALHDGQHLEARENTKTGLEANMDGMILTFMTEMGNMLKDMSYNTVDGARELYLGTIRACGTPDAVQPGHDHDESRTSSESNILSINGGYERNYSGTIDSPKFMSYIVGDDACEPYLDEAHTCGTPDAVQLGHDLAESRTSSESNILSIDDGYELNSSGTIDMLTVIIAKFDNGERAAYLDGRMRTILDKVNNHGVTAAGEALQQCIYSLKEEIIPLNLYDAVLCSNPKIAKALYERARDVALRFEAEAINAVNGLLAEQGAGYHFSTTPPASDLPVGMASLNIMGKPIDQPYEPGDEQWRYRRSGDPEPRQRRCGSPDNMEGMTRYGLRMVMIGTKLEEERKGVSSCSLLPPEGVT